MATYLLNWLAILICGTVSVRASRLDLSFGFGPISDSSRKSSEPYPRSLSIDGVSGVGRPGGAGEVGGGGWYFTLIQNAHADSVNYFI